MITNSWISTARAAVLGVALTVATLFTLSAHAETPSNRAPSVVVKYRDLDLSTEAGVHALYRRIVNAAERVCPDKYTRDLWLISVSNACRAEAVARAIHAVNNPRLVALHEQSALHG